MLGYAYGQNFQISSDYACDNMLIFARVYFLKMLHF